MTKTLNFNDKNDGVSLKIPLAEYFEGKNCINYKLASIQFPGLLLSKSNYHSHGQSQLDSLVMVLNVAFKTLT